MAESGHKQTKEANLGSRSSASQLSESWSNPRKRPHHHYPSTLFEPVGDDDYLYQIDDDKALHAAKRSRGPEWPLKNTDEASEIDPSTPSEADIAGTGNKRFSASSIRPSRFLEGSMNDKVSQKPPGIYTGDDEAMEQYATSQANDEHELGVTYDAGTQSNKHSGMFRFGKALASAFNAINIWQGVNGIRKEKKKEQGSQANAEEVMIERQAKAAIAYAELKKTGYMGKHVGFVQRPTIDVSATESEDIENKPRDSFRDSGIDVECFRSSSDQANSGQLAGFNDTLNVPQSRGPNNSSVSLTSNASSGRKSSMHFRKPSLQDLRKVKSHIRLSSSKVQAECALAMRSPDIDSAVCSTLPAPGLHKEPSKKDIAKQYKLSKKVSDLENKLETARRDLEQSMSKVPRVPEVPARIGRKSFIPAALASLPSERNMATGLSEAGGVPTQKAEISGEDANDIEESTPPVPKHSSKHSNGHLRPTSKYSISTRRGSARFPIDDQPNHLHNESDDVVIVEPAESKKSCRKATRRGKAPEVETPDYRGDTEIPPLPAKPKAFDPIEFDQAKIIAMRSSRNGKAAFASIPEDIHNLWKAYPGAAEDQLSQYIRSQPGFNKISDPTSVLHPLRSKSFLGPPISASPMRTRSKRSSKRGISPPPPSLASAKKPRTEIDSNWTALEGVESPVLGESKEQPPNSKTLKRKNGQLIEPRNSHTDKPLPDIQKEDYDWPEDVF
ncbi:hypothetical protein N7G274_010763 [Stereocaulon virgatum]|uniref:Nuclear RNA binding protein n=1 Tax=Stereocaulon virgatum TaxID=373712 RepID=A0ABR3ZWT4_9LECA